MATTALTAEQEEYLAYIVSSAEQLKHVVSDILDFRQLGTELVIEKQPISIRECLNESLQQAAIPTISESHASGVTTHVSDDVPEFIVSDRGRIVQVLVNLIHNTIRYTHRDARQVQVAIDTVEGLSTRRPSLVSSTSSITFNHPPPSPKSTTATSATLSIVPPTLSSSTESLAVESDVPASPSRSSALPPRRMFTFPPTYLPSSPSSSPLPAHVAALTSITALLPTPLRALLPTISQLPPFKAFAAPTTSTSPPPSPPISPSSIISPLAAALPSATPPESRFIRITVRDNGTGIAPSELSSVFQQENSLSKTKHVVELLGGELKIESEGTGLGTTATVTLKVDVWIPPSPPPPPAQSPVTSSPHRPFRSPSYPAPHRQPAFSASRPLSLPSLHNSPSSSPVSSPIPAPDRRVASMLKGINVLLVEDNLMNQKVLRRLFSKLGITPDVASHGADAVEYIRNKKYDIVFMDLHMPVCNGFEATRQIHELPQTYHKPHIFALTASVSAADREKCMQLGMRGHINKPVSVQALVDAMVSVTVE